MPTAVPSWAAVLMIPGRAAAPAWLHIGAQAGGRDRGEPDARPGRGGAQRHRPRLRRQRDQRGVSDRDERETGGDQAPGDLPGWPRAALHPGGQDGRGDHGQAERQQAGRRLPGSSPQRILQVQRDQREDGTGGRRVEQAADRPESQPSGPDQLQR